MIRNIIFDMVGVIIADFNRFVLSFAKIGMSHLAGAMLQYL